MLDAVEDGSDAKQLHETLAQTLPRFGEKAAMHVTPSQVGGRAPRSVSGKIAAPTLYKVPHIIAYTAQCLSIRKICFNEHLRLVKVQED